MENEDNQTGLERDLCIVLRAVPYAEADLILTLFSRARGRIDARAYGARSMKSRIRAACQPFCLAEFEFYAKKDRLSVRAADIRSEFFGIQKNFKKYVCACTALELIEKALRGAQGPELEDLFRLLAVFLTALDAFEGNPDYLLLFFGIRIVYLLGVFPALDTCVECGKPAKNSTSWSWTEGGIVCRACAEGRDFDTISPAVLACLRTFGRSKPASERDLAQDATTVRDAIHVMQDMLRHHFGISLRSARLLAR